MSPLARSARESAILARHVTNVDGNVYCIVNLPEEVIAVIFAYVSRSELSFRDNLLRLLKAGDLGTESETFAVPHYEAAAQRAADFHQRWVVGYGHSSVAEHAVAHVGVEKISRLVSAELELANPFLSFTEYSQRYQKPKRGDFYIPSSLPQPLIEKYSATMSSLYDIYEILYERLLAYLDRESPPLAGETADARERRLAKVAFEDARYALPLATMTNLGLTGNGRALRDAIALLRALPLSEAGDLGDQMATEVSKVLPALLRHAQPSPHQLTWRDRVPKGNTNVDQTGRQGGPVCQLLRYTGQEDPDPEKAAAEIMAGAMAATGSAPGAIEAYREAALASLGPHDTPPLAFHWVRYDCLFTLSEAAWHQLLRHCRGMHFQWSSPGVNRGYTVPPHIDAAGATDLLARATDLSQELHALLLVEAPNTAGYAVTNAHRRTVRGELDLRQLYHLVNLRTSEQAQWDIRDAVQQLWDQVLAVHPSLASKARRSSS